MRKAELVQRLLLEYSEKYILTKKAFDILGFKQCLPAFLTFSCKKQRYGVSCVL